MINPMRPISGMLDDVARAARARAAAATEQFDGLGPQSNTWVDDYGVKQHLWDLPAPAAPPRAPRVETGWEQPHMWQEPGTGGSLDGLW